MADFITLSELIALKGTLTAEQEETAATLIPMVCSELRLRAHFVGKDLDALLEEINSFPVTESITLDSATAATLAHVPQSVLSVTVNGADAEYTRDGAQLTFTEAQTGVLSVVYIYSAYAEVVKSVVADIVVREIDMQTESSDNAIITQATQMTESALGYSQSYTLPNSGGGLFVKRADLKRLGLTRQKLGAFDMIGGCNA